MTIPLCATVLDSLAEAADHRRDGHATCPECERGRFCPDRQADLATAALYDGAAELIRHVTSDHWLIAVLRGEPPKQTRRPQDATRGNPA